MDHRRELKGDCARCAGLCCVALGFDAGESFAFDKPADDPCRHLRRDHACGIHGQLAQRGFAGCASYDCYGAGQRVSQMFGAESSWR